MNFYLADHQLIDRLSNESFQELLPSFIQTLQQIIAFGSESEISYISSQILQISDPIRYVSLLEGLFCLDQIIYIKFTQLCPEISNKRRKISN